MRRTSPPAATPPSGDALARLLASLQHFRHVRAFRGHVQDGDELCALARAVDEADVRNVAARLGLALRDAAPDAPQPVLGVSYPAAEMASFPRLVSRSCRLVQPGRVTLAGVSCHVSIAFGAGITISLFGADGDLYSVTETDARHAARLEASFAGVPVTFVDPPVDHPRCLCPKYHPAFFAR